MLRGAIGAYLLTYLLTYSFCIFVILQNGFYDDAPIDCQCTLTEYPLYHTMQKYQYIQVFQRETDE